MAPVARLQSLCAHVATQHLSAPSSIASSASVAAATSSARLQQQHPCRFLASPYPDELQKQADFFMAHGYCLVDGAVAGQELAAVQAAYARHSPPVRAAWQEAKERAGVTMGRNDGSFSNTSAEMKVDLGPPMGEITVKNLPDTIFDIPRAAELGDEFVRLAEAPLLMPLLFKVMGPDLELMQINVRTTVPAAATTTTDGSGGMRKPRRNRGWHRDMESAQEGWSHPTLSSRVPAAHCCWLSQSSFICDHISMCYMIA